MESSNDVFLRAFFPIKKRVLRYYIYMIDGESLAYLDENKHILSCEDFSFDVGVKYLSYSQRDIYSALSLSNPRLITGSLSVNGVKLTPNGFIGGKAGIIHLNIPGIGSLLLVSFYKGTEIEITQFFNSLVVSLKKLKASSKKSIDDHQKIQELKEVFLSNPVSYILCDLEHFENQEHRLLFSDIFSRDFDGVFFFLCRDPRANFLQGNEKKALFREGSYGTYRFALMVTSFLSTISLFCWIFLVKTNGFALGILALLFAFFFLVLNVLLGIRFFDCCSSSLKKRNSIVEFEWRNTASNVIGMAVGLLAGLFFSNENISSTQNLFTGFGLVCISLFGFLLLFAQAVIARAKSE